MRTRYSCHHRRTGYGFQRRALRANAWSSGHRRIYYQVHAICPHCGNLATHSYRISEEEDTIVLGEKDKYEPRCRACFGMGKILTFS
ncbi:MAG: hypothetical protein U0T81_10615 [Saprospiraceae bacterium]